MFEKYFLVNPKVDRLSNEAIATIAKDKLQRNSSIWETREKVMADAMQRECALKCVHGRVIVKVNIETKNYHKFSDGTVIRRERKYNNFNFREVNPSNGFVVSAENIPAGAEVLFDYTSMHDSYKIFDYDSGSNDVNYYSIKEEECYAWRMERDNWQPTKNCEFGLRVFTPYKGLIAGIEPTVIKDTLYVTTGAFKGSIVRTLKGVDYAIVYQNDEGKEGQLIRFRHSNDSEFEREEVIGIAHDLTEQLNNRELLIGISPKDAKQII